MFPEPLSLFGFSIHPFGIVAAVSLMLGYVVTYGEMKRLGMPVHVLPDLAFAVMIGAFLGARGFFVLEHAADFLSSPRAIFGFSEGGLALHGGILGGLLGGYWFCRRKKLSFSALSDPVALGLSFGLALSRLGCLAAGCCYGRPTALPWGIVFENPAALAHPLHTALHPTQLYSFFAGLAIFFFLLQARKRKAFDGQVLLTFFVLECAAWLAVGFFRTEPTWISRVFVLLFLAVSGIRLAHHVVQHEGEKAMANHLFKLTALVLAVAFFAACGIIKTQKISRGHDIRQSEVGQIQKGVDTEKDILKIFGPPTKWRDTEEGKEFFYEYAKAGGPQWNLVLSVGGGTATKTLLVWFDKQGVVTDYAYKTS